MRNWNAVWIELSGMLVNHAAPWSGRRMSDLPAAAVSPFRAGLLCRCPRCGKGALYRGLLAVAPRCAVCDLDLAAHDSGDGPAAFAILLLGLVVVGAALITEVRFAPPLWVHAILWTPLILVGSIALLRPLKATMVALHYKHTPLA
jgi:uncharacterized protein (DUF983 family)